MIENIKWLGHASILIEKDGKVIYVDPWKLKNGKEADLILITHSHYDHFSIEDINKIMGKETVLIGPKDVVSKMGKGISLLPGEKKQLDWVEIEGVFAYNIGKSFHPKESNNLGFLIKFPDASIYIGGDTDFIPEMENLKADIVILPVGGTYTMDAEEAAKAVNTIKPKFAIPIHYGDIVGSESDALKFKSLVKESEVVILKPE